MGSDAGDGKVCKQGAVVESAGDLAYAAAHPFHENAVLYDVCGAVAPRLGARAHRIVEREFLFGGEHDAVYRACGESDVVFAPFGAVAVIGGEVRDEGDLGSFGVSGRRCHKT